MAISPIGCRVIIQENESNPCCICTRNDTYKKCCRACKQEICTNCIIILTEQGDPCPYCRQTKGYEEIGGAPQRVFINNVKTATQKEISRPTTQTREESEEPRSYCSENICDWQLSPLLKSRIILCRTILIDTIIVFGVGIVSRMIFGIIIPMFQHPDVFVIEFMLTITVGLLTIVVGGFLIFLLCCICLPAIIHLSKDLLR